MILSLSSPLSPFTPPFPLPLPLPCPPLSFPLLLCPPLEVGPLNPATGSRGALWALPAGSGASANAFWHILRLWNASGRNNFNDFPDNQLTKRTPVCQSVRNKWRYDFKPTREVPVYHTGAYRLTWSPVWYFVFNYNNRSYTYRTNYGHPSLFKKLYFQINLRLPRRSVSSSLCGLSL